MGISQHQSKVKNENKKYEMCLHAHHQLLLAVGFIAQVKVRQVQTSSNKMHCLYDQHTISVFVVIFFSYNFAPHVRNTFTEKKLQMRCVHVNTLTDVKETGMSWLFERNRI